MVVIAIPVGSVASQTQTEGCVLAVPVGSVGESRRACSQAVRESKVGVVRDGGSGGTGLPSRTLQTAGFHMGFFSVFPFRGFTKTRHTY
jgi:hypothetical protein